MCEAKSQTESFQSIVALGNLMKSAKGKYETVLTQFEYYCNVYTLCLYKTTGIPSSWLPQRLQELKDMWKNVKM